MLMLLRDAGGAVTIKHEPTAPGPRQVFDSYMRLILSNEDVFGTLAADDIVVEMPFAAPGRPRRIAGRDQLVATATAGRAALPVRFDEFRTVVIHDTADPEVIVVEFELAGMITTTGRLAAAPFIGVLTVRDGKITRWREYQDTRAMAAALAEG
jgi:uncharacterized protein